MHLFHVLGPRLQRHPVLLDDVRRRLTSGVVRHPDVVRERRRRRRQKRQKRRRRDSSPSRTRRGGGRLANRSRRFHGKSLPTLSFLSLTEP